MNKQSLTSASTASFPVVAAWIAGTLATLPNLTPWYAALIKPPFNPPNWLFGPVWIALYALMIIGSWRVIGSASKHRTIALILFFAQLLLNAAWPLMFFAAHSPLLGLLNIVFQLPLVIAATVQFFRVDRWAGWCLVPLCLWVAFAAILNFSIWSLN